MTIWPRIKICLAWFHQSRTQIFRFFGQSYLKKTLEPIIIQNLVSWLIKYLSHSNFNTRSPDSVLVRSYLFATVLTKFGCSIDAAQKQMALNFELVVTCKRLVFLSIFSCLQVIWNSAPYTICCYQCNIQ